MSLQSCAIDRSNTDTFSSNFNFICVCAQTFLRDFFIYRYIKIRDPEAQEVDLVHLTVAYRPCLDTSFAAKIFS
jgi:hypothetical protein